MNEKDICRRLLKDGSYHIFCRRRLWGVVAPNLRQAEAEASRYWSQYAADGEYDDET